MDLHERLTPPTQPVRVVLDTDTYNEVDDQFAVVHALLSPGQIQLEALTAAPFDNDRSDGPADGMRRSYDEILQLLDRMHVGDTSRVFAGADRYLTSRNEPVGSDAVEQIVELSEQGSGPLYVAAIGAITNIASAILRDPTIIERIVVVWLGGQPLHWPHAREFNLTRDVTAAQVVFDSGVPLVHVPCAAVASHLLTTMPELSEHVRPHGDIGQYLWQICDQYRNGQAVWSKVIWDVAVTGWLIDPTWVASSVVPSPILTDQVTWSIDPERHPVCIAHSVQRDGLFGDLFDKLRRFADGQLAPTWD